MISALRAGAAAGVVLALLGTAGCGSPAFFVRPDYDQVDRTRLKRIGIYAEPVPGVPKVVQKLSERIAKRFLASPGAKKDYLVLSSGKPDPKGVDGMLLLTPLALARDGDDVEVHMLARLVRAKDEAEVWRAELSDETDWRDEDLAKTTEVYVKELGPAAEPFAAPLFVVLQPLLATLPSPLLNDEDIVEKLALD